VAIDIRVRRCLEVTDAFRPCFPPILRFQQLLSAACRCNMLTA